MDWKWRYSMHRFYIFHSYLSSEKQGGDFQHFLRPRKTHSKFCNEQNWRWNVFWLRMSFVQFFVGPIDWFILFSWKFIWPLDREKWGVIEFLPFIYNGCRGKHFSHCPYANFFNPIALSHWNNFEVSEPASWFHFTSNLGNGCTIYLHVYL